MHGIDFSGGGNVGGEYIKIPVCEKDNYNNKNGDFISRFVHNEKIKKKKPQMLYVHAMYILK